MGQGYFFDNDVNSTSPTNFFVANTYRRTFNVSGVGQYVWGGCGEQITINSITFSGTTATVTTSGEHFIHASGSWVTISGATGVDASIYNGTFIGTRTSSTVFTYTMSGTPSGNATGSLVKSSPFDGNTDSTGYRCLDQAGSGQGVLYTNSTPATITPVSAANNALEPIYAWNNRKSGTVSPFVAVSATDIIQENREYYNQNDLFNGTAGIGRGLRANRPTTCTTGVAYWSTDGGGNWNTSTTETYSDTPGEDGGLDKCTATNTWTNDWYVPYTYPHPLTSGDPPADPGNRRFSPIHNLRRAAMPVWPVPYVNTTVRGMYAILAKLNKEGL